MAHHCKDCSYRGERSGQLGECPACGSFNIVQRSANVNAKEQPSAARWRIVVLVVLWGSLIVMVIGKLSH